MMISADARFGADGVDEVDETTKNGSQTIGLRPWLPLEFADFNP
jgi:hypothetical protein